MKRKKQKAKFKSVRRPQGPLPLPDSWMMKDEKIPGKMKRQGRQGQASLQGKRSQHYKVNSRALPGTRGEVRRR